MRFERVYCSGGLTQSPELLDEHIIAHPRHLMFTSHLNVRLEGLAAAYK
jgi:hypothetical protein